MFQEKERANEFLRWAIKVAKGRCFKSPPTVRYSVLLDCLKTLKNSGFWWQAKILNYWIHRFLQSEGLTPIGGGEVSK